MCMRIFCMVNIATVCNIWLFYPFCMFIHKFTSLWKQVLLSVLSSEAAFVLQVASSVEEELHLLVICYVSSSCIGHTRQGGNEGRQLAE